MNDGPYRALEPLPAQTFREVWLDTVFDHFKWDPQIGDTSILADFPLVLSTQAWQELSQQAERLAAEALAAEAELLHRPELHAALGLPKAVQRAWRDPDRVHIRCADDVRIIRFDFHYTTEGWRISEANIDTPGGLIEGGGFAQRMAAYYPHVQLAGDPADALARAIRQRLAPGGLVALIHATAYADDRQILLYLGRLLEREGLRTCLISPAQVRWQQGQASVATDWFQGRADYLYRFFPAEWLPNLPRGSGWQRYFDGCQVPATNPASALLVQSKRFPLVWDRLAAPLPTWRALLPQTCDPRAVRERSDGAWVLKPVLSRAGEDVTLHGVATPREWQRINRAARRHPDQWIVQHRFEPVPLVVNGTGWYPCIGVYTVDGKTAGIYGRAATRPLIAGTAKDVAVFVEGQTKGV